MGMDGLFHGKSGFKVDDYFYFRTPPIFGEHNLIVGNMMRFFYGDLMWDMISIFWRIYCWVATLVTNHLLMATNKNAWNLEKINIFVVLVG